MKPARERIFNVPLVVVATTLLLVAIHALRDFLPDKESAELLAQFGFVPGRFTYAFDPQRVAAAYDIYAGSDPTRAVIAQFFLGDGRPLWWTAVTYSVLHVSWAHVGMNCLWFVAFGAAVARRFGAPRFLIFCLAAAIAGALAHYLTHMDELQPMIGASAVVSAAMAAAIRFVFQPGAPLSESLGLVDGHDEDHAYRQPAMSLPAVFTDRRALSFLVIWMLVNILFGVSSAMPGLGNATIAWQAHIGGFVLGLFCFRFFDRPRPPREGKEA
jgi:membrane associated rhomboid family serine protease